MLGLTPFDWEVQIGLKEVTNPCKQCILTKYANKPGKKYATVIKQNLVLMSNCMSN